MDIDIMLSCSSGYLPYAMVTIASVIGSKSSDTLCRFYLFCLALSQEQMQQVYEQFSRISDNRCELHIYDINEALSKRGIDLLLCTGQETAGNLLAAELLPNSDRILALDCDVIVRRDLSELFQTDMSGALLAGVRDYDFAGQYYSGNRQYRTYYADELGLKDPASYLQGGVLLINLAAMRTAFPAAELFLQFAERKFRYDEQDFWNISCAGQKVLVDPRWNVMHDNDGYRVRYVIGLAPETWRQEYHTSRQDPWIVHYAGGDKPWKNRQCDFADVFWDVVETFALPIVPPKEEKRGVYAAGLDVLRWVRNELRRFLSRYIQNRGTE